MGRKLPQWIKKLSTEYKCEEVLCFQPSSLYKLSFTVCVNSNLIHKNQELLSHIFYKLPKINLEVVFSGACCKLLCIATHPHIEIVSSHDLVWLWKNGVDWFDAILMYGEEDTCKRSELNTYGKDIKRFSCKRRLFE